MISGTFLSTSHNPDLNYINSVFRIRDLKVVKIVSDEAKARPGAGSGVDALHTHSPHLHTRQHLRFLYEFPQRRHESTG